VLLVRDRVAAARSVEACCRLHLHPSCEILEVQGDVVRVAHGDGRFAVAFAGPGELSVEPSYHCPEFGKKLETRALAYRGEGRSIETGFCVASGDDLTGCDLASGAAVGETRYGW
jgi:hypothetical protein